MTQVGANQIHLIKGRRYQEVAAPARPAAPSPAPLAGRYEDTFVRAGSSADMRLLRYGTSRTAYTAPAVQPAVVPATPPTLTTPSKAPELPKGTAPAIPENDGRPAAPAVTPKPAQAAQATAPAPTPAPAPSVPVATVVVPPVAAPVAPVAPATIAPISAIVVPVDSISPPILDVPPPPPPAPLPPPVVAPIYAPRVAEAGVTSAIATADSLDAAYQAAVRLVNEQLQPRETPARPDRPAPAADPAGEDRLKTMSPEELKRLGQNDKKGFFAALRPAAEAAERRYGVPAAITMAQAALETGWGNSIIPGYNIFGIKGRGPAGTVSKGTWEVYNGRRVEITANFAKYHNFYEAVFEHGKLFHNGYYTKAMNNFERYKDPVRFARDITGTYATDPEYGDKLISIMRTYDLI